MRIALLVASLGLVLQLPAQDTTMAELVTEARLHLHADPSESGDLLRTLPRGTRLTLLRPGSLRSDFYRVATAGGDTGWVAFPYVRPADSSSLAPSVAIAISTQIISEDEPAEEISEDWYKPRVIRSVFVSSSGDRCSEEGTEGSDWRTNVRKNRPDSPRQSYAITWDALADTVTLPFARGGLPTKRTGWSDEETAEVARFEGIPVTVTGFFYKIKPQASNGESTNCGFTGEANTDWHVAFTGGHEGIEEESVVIEPTPRFKKKNAKWKRATFREYEADRRSEGDSIRITGYLFYDPSHANHLDRYRLSMWEIHPITRIEVLHNGTWRALTN